MIGLNGYIAGGAALVIAGLGTALYFTGKWALSERDQRVVAEYNIKLRDATDELKKEHAKALEDIRTASDDTVTRLEAENKELTIANQKAMLTAQLDAEQDPITFGDNVLRNFIRIDCLWNAGSGATSASVRAACSDEAENADPTSTGVFFSTITPELLRRWGDACSDLKTFGGGPEWEDSHPGVNPRVCMEPLLAMTPETAQYLSTWATNGENYTTRLVEYALEQNLVIDQITKKDD